LESVKEKTNAATKKVKETSKKAADSAKTAS